MKKWLPLFILIFLSCKEEVVVTAEPEPIAEPRILVHPSFDLTLEELLALTNDQLPEITQNIEKKPQVFLELALQALSLPEDALVLVDKQHALSENHVPETIVELDNYPLLARSRKGHQLNGWALPSLLAMSETASQQGISLLISSTYRSFSYQEQTYNWCVEQYGQEEADRVSAFPGKSQHQLGNTVDFGNIDESFEFTDAGQWLLKHAGDFGWSLSYPKGMEEVTGYKYEVWHYRYITPVGTRIQQDFFMDVQQYFLSWWHDNKEILASNLI